MIAILAIVVIVLGARNVLSEFRGVSLEAILAFALGLLIGWLV